VSTTVSVSNQTISFDYVADEAASQEEIYLELGEPLVQNCIDGYNASILCYGQTGSGKSYTMFGNSSFFAQPSGNSTNPAVPTPKATGQATPKVGGNGSNSSSNNNNPNSSSSSSADNWDPFQDRERGLVPRILEALWQPSSGSGGATSNHIILGTPSYEAGDTSPLASPSEDRARRFSLRPTPELAVTLAGLAVGGSPSEGMRRQSVSVAIARKLKCRCSFYEIYQEKVFDLLDLDTTHSSAGLAVREDTLLGVYVAGLTECEVSSQEEARAIMLRGYANRRVAETAMNRESSRSHAIFQLLLEFSECRMDGAIVTKAAKMCMVDLAGSERQRDTLATNARLKEAAAINKSLSTLGRVINSLVEAAGGKTATYIPFRDSKLTFLLRDALGGNSKVIYMYMHTSHLSNIHDINITYAHKYSYMLMFSCVSLSQTTLVATVSPSIESLGDSLSTLKFVNRAKRICTAAVSSERPVESVLELQREIAKLKAMLVHAQAAHGGRAASAEVDSNAGWMHAQEYQCT
jgi:kinesin family protein 15